MKTKFTVNKITVRTAEELVVLTLSAWCLSVLTFMAVENFLRYEFDIAIGSTTGALSTLVTLVYVLFTGRVKGAGLFLALLTVGGITLIVMMLGPGEIHFLYPMVVCAYFLVVPNIALLIGLTSVVLLTPALQTQMEAFEFAKFIFSMLGCIFLSYTFARIRNSQRDDLLKLSKKDGLTGAGNRRAMDEKLSELISMSQRSEIQMCLILLDLDKFKLVNDREGHVVGDQILVRVTNVIESRIRTTDGLYRYGGDEFVILAVGDKVEDSLGLAEEVRAMVESNEVIEGTNISLSLGVAEYIQGQSARQWLNSADKALLRAKREGRNKVLAATV